MIIYIDGCSHSFGEIQNNILPYSELFKRSLFSEVVNNSEQGKSNDAIFTDTIYRLSLLEDIKKIHYVVQFSSPNRRAHMLPTGKRVFVNPYDNTKYNLKLEPLASNDTLCYIYALQNIFNNLGINYCMFSYFPIERTEKSEMFIKDNIDLSKFIKCNDSTHPLFGGFIDYMKKNNLTKDIEGHPSQKGHYFLFEKIKKYYGDFKLI